MYRARGEGDLLRRNSLDSSTTECNELRIISWELV